MRSQALVLLAGALLLSACAAPAGREEAPAGPMAFIGQLDELVSRLPGRYGAARRLDLDQTGTRMSLSARSGAGAELLLEFREDLDNPQRGFVLTLDAGGASPFIAGSFVPLRADGTLSAHTCPMRFRVRDGLLSGQTDPQQCRFGTGAESVGLLKEVALDGSRIVIADQLIGVDGNVGEPADILRLYRLERFQGQVRVRDEAWPESGWRTSTEVQLETGADAVEPVDAANMGLSVLLRLALIQGQQPGSPLLYLQASDAETGTVLGQAWSDRQALRLGLALDQVQVDLEKLPSAP